MKTEYITIIIRVIMLIITGIIIPALRQWIISRTEHQKLDTLKEWAYTVVWAAEQMHHYADRVDPGGVKRKQYARDAIMQMADRIGMKISYEEATAMIECAVHELNGCKVPAINEMVTPEKEEKK